ncbi:MAG: hypothetical protein IPK13_05635 [Deltaproteobacteria bacterium]|nr:hypothetical protein [Deltaproteobacteria bacterium]
MGNIRVLLFLGVSLMASEQALGRPSAAGELSNPGVLAGPDSILDLAGGDESITLYVPKLAVMIEIVPQLKDVIAALREPVGSAMSNPRFEAMGIDPSQPLLMTWVPREGALVAVFGLSHRARLEQWLKALRDTETNATLQLDVPGSGPSKVWLIDAATENPIACVLGTTQGYCQFGAGPQGRPLHPLQATLTRRQSAIRPPHPEKAVQTHRFKRGPKHELARTRGGRRDDQHGTLRMKERLSRLRPGGAVYLIANMRTLGDTLVDFEAQRLRRAYQFSGQAEREQGEIQQREMKHLANSISQHTKALVAGLYIDPRRTAFEADVSLTRAGFALVSRALRPQPKAELIEAWASTPALAKLILRLRPGTLEQQAKALGMNIPRGHLTGALAVLWLGLDSECPAAKAPPAKTNWPFVLPTAVALGAAKDPETFAEALRELIDHQEPSPPPHPIEVGTLGQTILLGTGRGAGAAALRRLRSVETKQKEKAISAVSEPLLNSLAKEPDAPFLEATIDLLAIDAALGAIVDAGPGAQPNLEQLVRARERLRPAFDAASRVGLRATLKSDTAEPSLQLVLHGDE